MNTSIKNTALIDASDYVISGNEPSSEMLTSQSLNLECYNTGRCNVVCLS